MTCHDWLFVEHFYYRW